MFYAVQISIFKIFKILKFVLFTIKWSKIILFATIHMKSVSVVAVCTVCMLMLSLCWTGVYKINTNYQYGFFSGNIKIRYFTSPEQVFSFSKESPTGALYYSNLVIYKSNETPT